VRGPDAAAFPTVESEAAFIARCVALDIPFKATAGLHQPVRHYDTEIGVEHHGFVNLWTATARAAAGAEEAPGGSRVDCLSLIEKGWSRPPSALRP